MRTPQGEGWIEVYRDSTQAIWQRGDEIVIQHLADTEAARLAETQEALAILAAEILNLGENNV